MSAGAVTLGLVSETHGLVLLHDLAELDLDPAAAGFDAVVTGHSHPPKAFERQGVLYVSPGSAGLRAELVELSPERRARNRRASRADAR